MTSNHSLGWKTAARHLRGENHDPQNGVPSVSPSGARGQDGWTWTQCHRRGVEGGSWRSLVLEEPPLASTASRVLLPLHLGGCVCLPSCVLEQQRSLLPWGSSQALLGRAPPKFSCPSWNPLYGGGVSRLALHWIARIMSSGHHCVSTHGTPGSELAGQYTSTRALPRSLVLLA